ADFERRAASGEIDRRREAASARNVLRSVLEKLRAAGGRRHRQDFGRLQGRRAESASAEDGSEAAEVDRGASALRPRFPRRTRSAEAAVLPRSVLVRVLKRRTTGPHSRA